MKAKAHRVIAMSKKEKATIVIAIACILVAISILLTSMRRQRAFHPEVSHPAVSTALPVPMSILQQMKPQKLSPTPAK